MTHRLDPLLRPRSIAVVGASERPGSVGRTTVHNLLAGGFDGPLYPVNPNRRSVLGLPCHPELAALPEPVEHVVFCVADRRVEAVLEAAIAHGARAATLMSQLVVDGDPGLAERLRGRVRSAGLLLCGPNGMGFYNARDGVWVCGFDTRENHPRKGAVTLISQSGAGMSGIVDCEERIDFGLAVSTGSEFTVGLADYLDFALETQAPKVIGLFMETARDPAALAAALDKAQRRQVPVVALKVGRTRYAAELARSHSGAVAGVDAAYQALFDRHGVQRVEDMHELVAALMLFAQPQPIPKQGALMTLHDSGGERQLLVDLAEAVGTPLGTPRPATVSTLETLLDPGLPAVNPLDGWGAGGADADDTMAECLAVLMRDPDAAIGAVVHDRGPHSAVYPDYLAYLKRAREASGKPLALVANHAGSGADPLAVAATRAGFPVLDGLRPFLVAARAVLAWRDQRERAAPRPPELDARRLAQARAVLAAAAPLDEGAALGWLADLGFPATDTRIANGAPEAVAAAEALGFPVALKTAMPGLAHKSDRGGVHLQLRDAAAVAGAYQDLSSRLGPRVLVAPMAPAGVEMALGMVRDEQFGPLVVLGFGGVAMEALDDTVCALPPFDAAEAQRLLDQLRNRALLDLARGGPPPDIDAFADLAARFSVLVAGLKDAVTEMDLNPVIVHRDGCHIVDALLVTAPARTRIERRAS